MTDPLASATAKKGYRKVVAFCHLAAQLGFSWAWVDTCCIDKANLVELTESIKSMLRWYQEAALCCGFLSDLPAKAQVAEALPRCRWFSRGWTLQELLAPAKLEFYDQDWVQRGAKEDLTAILSTITGISAPVLCGDRAVQEVGVATRMSWAANRKTTRPEDMTYCLVGLFDINMPMIYGEGVEKSFRRLREEIIRQSNDLTIFAWAPNSEGHTDLIKT